MCTVLLPPGDNEIAVNKYIISHHINCPGTNVISTFEELNCYIANCQLVSMSVKLGLSH